MTDHKVCLICIDGWGVAPPGPGNAITNANTPVMRGLKESGLSCEIDASGLSVGLPAGLMGNSEVGHMHIGSGRRDYGDLVKIDLAIQEGRLADAPGIVDAFSRAKAGTGRLHLLGLLSDGGVHSHILHLLELLSAAQKSGVPKAWVHAFTDGRDTPPNSGEGFLTQLQDAMAARAYGSVGSLCGRYYAMDRDKRWERLKVALDCLTGVSPVAPRPDALCALRESYAAGVNDEFLKPILVDADSVLREGDVLLFFNYRADRMREIVEVIGFAPTGAAPDGSVCPPPPFPAAGYPIPRTHIFQMTGYNSAFPFPVLFPKTSMDNVLSEWISKKGISQYKVAETEKYAHVTFFFNGGRELQFDKEDRLLVPSPKVATYDLAPAMSSEGVAKGVADALRAQKYPFVCLNFAAPDMVGHTGMMEKAVVACEATDAAIGVVWEACREAGYVLVITSDHGNAEVMLAGDGTPFTAHTANKVPFIVAGLPEDRYQLSPRAVAGGELTDVAPTVLALMGIPSPPEMTGQPLVRVLS